MAKFKIVNKKGSAMVLAIILMSLFFIVATLITSQINNNLKVTNKTYKETKYKYKAEAIVDERIATIYEDMFVFINEINKTYPKIPLGKQETKGSTSQISKEIYCYTDDNGKKNYFEVKAKIYEIIGKKGQIVRKQVESFDVTQFENLHIQGIYLENSDKYKVINNVTFDINDDFKLSYEIKEYKKEYIE